MQIIPLGARVLIQRQEVKERTTEGGLLIPERSAPPTYIGKVLAVGDGITKSVAVGDQVLTTQYVGDEVRDNSVSYYLVGEEDLLAVIRREEDDGD